MRSWLQAFCKVPFRCFRGIYIDVTLPYLLIWFWTIHRVKHGTVYIHRVQLLVFFCLCVVYYWTGHRLRPLTSWTRGRETCTSHVTRGQKSHVFFSPEIREKFYGHGTVYIHKVQHGTVHIHRVQHGTVYIHTQSTTRYGIHTQSKTRYGVHTQSKTRYGVHTHSKTQYVVHTYTE